MSQPSETLDITVQASPPEEDTDDVTLEDVIAAFLDVNPTPSDADVHEFAELLGVPFETFEETIYAMFGDMLGEYADDDADLQDVVNTLSDRDQPEDPLDILLICFFSFKPEPTNREINMLAQLIGLTSAQLEERLYAMVAEMGDDADEPTPLLN